MRLRSKRSTPTRGFRLLGIVATVVSILVSSVIAPAAAHAAYIYNPSHPMISPIHGRCTGGWAIRSSLNIPYFLTAGHCFPELAEVHGRTSRFGFVEHAWRNNVDSAVVRPEAGIDARQEIPGIGRTVGKFGDGYAINAGNGLAMQGDTSGRTYGWTYQGWFYDDQNRRMACGSYPSLAGDSGAPIFAHNEHGAYAIGTHVGLWPGDRHCYVTIDDLLRTWTATLPVFPPGAAKSAVTEPILLGPSHDPAADSVPVYYIGKPISR